MKKIELNKSRLQFSRERIANLTGEAARPAAGAGGNLGQDQNAAAKSTETTLLCEFLSAFLGCLD